MRRRGRNFEEGILPLHIASQIFGLRFIEYPRGEIRYYVSGLYAMVVVVTMLVWRYWKGNIYAHDQFEAWVFRCIMEFDFAVVVGMIVFGRYTTESFYSIRKQAAYVENELQRLGLPINCDHLFKFGLAGLLFWIAWETLTYIMLDILPSEPPVFGWKIIIFTIVYYLRKITAIMVILDFMTAVMWLGSGFQQINRLLEMGLPDASNDKFGNSDNSKSIDKALAILGHQILDLHSRVFVGDTSTADGISGLAMKPCTIQEKRLYINTLRHVHLKLCTTAKSIYTLFNVPVILRIGQILMTITMLLNYVYNILSSKRKLKDPLYLYSLVTMWFFDVVKLSLVCIVGEYTMREIKQSTELIYTFGGLEDDFELKDDIHQFKLQMAASRQSLGSNGLSYMGFAFARQCISWVTTYLAIMIQMPL